MRGTSRLFAAVKGARYLEPGAPTGLTGLFTHPAPRSSLLYLYTTTLDKLKGFPADSVYRKSTEALTQHRLNIVRSVIPAGYDEWAARFEQAVKDNPDAFATPEDLQHSPSNLVKEVRDGKVFVHQLVEPVHDERLVDYDGATLDEVQVKEFKRIVLGEKEQLQLEPEPQLTADQVLEIENQIGAGLIEEVIEVAESELKLVDVMQKSKVWEDLEDKPAEGQWQYFARASHMPAAQPPPDK